MKITLHTTEFKKLYDQYDNMVQSKNYKTGKGKMYQACVKEFLSWMEQKDITVLDQITTPRVKEYLENLIVRPNKRRGGTLSASTINHHLFSLRLFFNHILDIGYADQVPVVPNNVERNSAQYATLSEEEIQMLYTYSENALEKAILSLAYGCGLRRSEISQLNVADLIFGTSILVVTKGKGNKVRDVIMSDTVIQDLKDYLFTERLDRIRNSKTSTGAFFLNGKGKRLSGDYLNKTLKKIVERTGDSELQNKNVCLHCMRHSIATHLVDRGLDMITIRSFLGHSEIDTTSLYMKRRKQKNKFIV